MGNAPMSSPDLTLACHDSFLLARGGRQFLKVALLLHMVSDMRGGLSGITASMMSLTCKRLVTSMLKFDRLVPTSGSKVQGNHAEGHD